MQRGLEGRRIALAVAEAAPVEQTDVIRGALRQAGAEVVVLRSGKGGGEDWHGGRYAGLVILGGLGRPGTLDPRLVQMTREFIASEKPVAASGEAMKCVIEAGGAAGRTLAAEPSLQPAIEAAGGKWVSEDVHADDALISASAAAQVGGFTDRVVAEFARHMEERDVDAMSEQSFPASDPPATTPASIGHVTADRDGPPRP